VSTSLLLLNALVDTFDAITLPRTFAACGETYVGTLDLAGRVHVASDPSEGSGLRVSVHAGPKRHTPGGHGLGAVTVEQDFHVFGVAPAASDTPIARVNAAQILEAHLLAALVEDRNNQTRVAAVKTDAQILPASETSEGGHEFERCGVVFLMVTIRWSSWLGV